MKQLELEEELLVGGLTSEGAKEFLSKIPTVDALLPIPNGNQAVIEQAR